MIAAVIFAAYAAAAGLLAPAALRGGRVASARLAMSLWLALQASWVVAGRPGLPRGDGTIPADLDRADARPRPGTYDRTIARRPGGRRCRGAPVRRGFRPGGLVPRQGTDPQPSRPARARRPGGRHRAPRPEPGVAVVDDDAPAAYCLPCGRYRVVISAGALDVLGTDQLRAVLAHERAHLGGRHHLILSVAAALSRAFPRVPLFTRAEPELGRLAEMAADDAAARRQGAEHLARALVILSKAGARPAALAAGGPAAVTRIERLLDPPRPRRARHARLSHVAALLFPAAIACLPLIMAACDVTARP